MLDCWWLFAFLEPRTECKDDQEMGTLHDYKDANNLISSDTANKKTHARLLALEFEVVCHCKESRGGSVG